jgi:hypothetical protein
MESTERASFRIGHKPETQLTISHACSVGRRVHYYGGGPDNAWHDFCVEASLPGFRASLTFITPLSDFRDLRDALEKMWRTLEGTVTIDSMENELHLTGSMNKMGHVTWEAALQRIDGMHINELKFRMDEDQSYLPRLIAEIDALLSEARAEPEPGPT